MTSQHKNGSIQHGDNIMNVKKEVDWPKVLFNIHVYLFGIISCGVFFEAKLLTILFSKCLFTIFKYLRVEQCCYCITYLCMKLI